MSVYVVSTKDRDGEVVGACGVGGVEESDGPTSKKGHTKNPI